MDRRHRAWKRARWISNVAHWVTSTTKQVLALLDASFEARKGAPLPVDWKLPVEIALPFKVEQRRSGAHAR